MMHYFQIINTSIDFSTLNMVKHLYYYTIFKIGGVLMSKPSFYMKLPYDLSGARSKSRFRNEVLWGLEKLFDTYKTGKDFSIVFDYVCDIEVHQNDSYEFYQVKTHNNASPYTLSQLVKLDKTGKSVLGKLYLLKQLSIDNCVALKVAIVSNTALKSFDNTLHSTCGELNFLDLSDSCKDKIKSKLKKELNLSVDVTLQDIYYIYTTMDLINPHNSLLGQTVNFFVEVKGEEPKKTQALFTLLSDTIMQKASYELQSEDYSNLVEKKGMTRKEVEAILNRYSEKTDIAVSKSISFIDSTYTSYNDRIKKRTALTKIVNNLLRSKLLQDKEIEIITYINSHIDELNGDIPCIIDTLTNKFGSSFPIEYITSEIKAFMLLILMRNEEGVYAQPNNK